MASWPDITRGATLVESAFDFAREAHHGPRREGDTNVDHPLAVARLLREAGFSDEVVAASLLHDVVEDTATTLGEIEVWFGPKVAELVAAVTEDDSIEPYERRKAAHRAQVVAGGRDAAAIFAADKLATAQRLRRAGVEPPPAKLEHYERTLAELRRAYPDLPFLRPLERELAAIRARTGSPNVHGGVTSR